MGDHEGNSEAGTLLSSQRLPLFAVVRVRRKKHPIFTRLLFKNTYLSPAQQESLLSTRSSRSYSPTRGSRCCHCSFGAPPRVTANPLVILRLCVISRHILITLRYLCHPTSSTTWGCGSFREERERNEPRGSPIPSDSGVPRWRPKRQG
jgi:hypothetical protein